MMKYTELQLVMLDDKMIDCLSAPKNSRPMAAKKARAAASSAVNVANDAPIALSAPSNNLHVAIHVIE